MGSKHGSGTDHHASCIKKRREEAREERECAGKKKMMMMKKREVAKRLGNRWCYSGETWQNPCLSTLLCTPYSLSPILPLTTRVSCLLFCLLPD